MILKHIIVLITSTDERISEQYIYYFEQIVFFYSDDKHNFPYSINDEFYENILDEDISNEEIFRDLDEESNEKI